MKMDEMNAYLESKGFTVNRTHSTIDGKSMYKFKIEKDGRSLTRTFEYPGGVATHIKNLKQEEFLDDTLRVFETFYPGVKADLVEIRSQLPWHESKFKAVFQDMDVASLYPTMPSMATQVMDAMYRRRTFSIKNVIFNDPATIVFWTDGSKTVVKAQDDDIFDPEKGLAMAITKKALGNKGNYCNELKKWLPKKYICMYCGADTTNPEWDHACDECRNTPFEPNTSALSDVVKAFRNFGKTVIDLNKKSNVEKAYEILTQLANNKGKLAEKTYEEAVEEAMGFLGQALED